MYAMEIQSRLNRNNGASVIARIFLAIAMISIILTAIITSVDICARDERWVRMEYEKLDISDYSGMSIDDMCRAFATMVDFMCGESDSMYVKVNYFGEEVEMYNQREVDHMHDVRELFSNVMLANKVMIGLIVIGIVIFLSIEKNNGLYTISKYYLICLASFLAIALLLGIWAIADFSSFWIFFHFIFLDVEGSTFDPAFSRMIRICPEELFSDMILRIFTFGLGACAIIAAIAGIYIIVRRKSGFCKELKKADSVKP